MQRATLLAALAALVAAPAAAEPASPRLSGGIGLEFQHDWTHDADDPDARGHDTYATIESVAVLRLTDRLSIEGVAILEPVQDRGPGRDRFADDHGLYVDTLQVLYELDGLTLHAGKFAAPFGLAQDAVPGLFGDTVSEGYELTERLGVGVATGFAAPGASVEIAAAAFRKDTSVLGRSYTTRRGRLRLDDGGGGNTDGPENISAAVTVGDMAAAPGLTLRLSALRQGKGRGDADGTWAWALGAVHEVALDNGVVLAPMVEYARAVDAIGVNDAAYTAGAREDYVTAGLGLAYGNWNAALAAGQRTGDVPGLATAKDRFGQMSAGYAFDNGIGIEVGWVHLDEGGQDSQTLGAVVAYSMVF